MARSFISTDLVGSILACGNDPERAGCAPSAPSSGTAVVVENTTWTGLSDIA